MSTTTTARSAEFTTALRQIGALARVEATLLRRNKTALINTIVMAPVLVLLLLPVVDDGAVHAAFGTHLVTLMAAFGTHLVTLMAAFGTHLVTLMAAFGLIFVAYRNLTTTVVARREELTLKRLTSATGSSRRQAARVIRTSPLAARA